MTLQIKYQQTDSIAMRAEVKHVEGMTFLSLAGGHLITHDLSVDQGGMGGGPNPMAQVLAAAAACSAIDVVQVLNKMRLEFTDLHVEIEAERSDGEPKVFTKLSLVYHIKGVPEAKMKRAVDLSLEKYCSVMNMLKHSAEIEYELDVQE